MPNGRSGHAVTSRPSGSSSFTGDAKAEPHELAFQLALVWHAKDLDPVIVRETQPMPSA
jgi:hypothetical protein